MCEPIQVDKYFYDKHLNCFYTACINISISQAIFLTRQLAQLAGFNSWLGKKLACVLYSLITTENIFISKEIFIWFLILEDFNMDYFLNHGQPVFLYRTINKATSNAELADLCSKFQFDGVLTTIYYYYYYDILLQLYSYMYLSASASVI